MWCPLRPSNHWSRKSGRRDRTQPVYADDESVEYRCRTYLQGLSAHWRPCSRWRTYCRFGRRSALSARCQWLPARYPDSYEQSPQSVPPILVRYFGIRFAESAFLAYPRCPQAGTDGLAGGWACPPTRGTAPCATQFLAPTPAYPVRPAGKAIASASFCLLCWDLQTMPVLPEASRE